MVTNRHIRFGFALLVGLVVATSARALQFDYPLGPPNHDGYGVTGLGGLSFLTPDTYPDPCGPVFHPGEDWNADGSGLDFGNDGNDAHDPVFAVADGSISYAQYRSAAWGNIVLVRHDGTFMLPSGGSTNRVWSQYAHLGTISLNPRTNQLWAPSDQIFRGEQLGTVGDDPNGSGLAFHLHFEIRLANLPAFEFPCRQPIDYVKKHYATPTSFIEANRSFAAVSNPSMGGDYLLAMARDNNSLYAVGSDSAPGNQQWRIEKRSKQSGQLIGGFGTLGVVTSDPSGGHDAALSVAVDDNEIYVVGAQYTAGFHQWRIEKRDAATGAPVTAFLGTGVVGGYTSGRTSPPDGSGAEAVQVYGNDLYVAGSEFIAGHYVWRIERRDKTTGQLMPEFNGTGVLNVNVGGYYQYLHAMQVDEAAIYIAGSNDGCGVELDHDWRIEKRDRFTGALINEFGDGGVIQTSACTGSYGYAEDVYGLRLDGAYLYAVGPDGVDGGTNFPQWRIEKRSASDGSLVNGFGTGGTVLAHPSGLGDLPYSLDVDANNLYVAGYVGGTDGPGVPLPFTSLSSNSKWRVEAREKTTGDLVPSFASGGILEFDYSSGDDVAHSVCADPDILYIAGYDHTPGNAQWRILAYGTAP